MNGDVTPGYASPACALHETDPAYSGLPPDVAAWRRGARERLLAWRTALPIAERAGMTERIVAGLEALAATLNTAGAPIVSAYWPFRGEPDLRPWLLAMIARGFRAALPIVVAKGAPLAFRLWTPETPLTRGVWDIPIPAEGEYVEPAVVVAPLVGFDAAGYRLGYGGGFYDRTLAALTGPRLAIGVGYAACELATIHPQPHDVPMALIVTEGGMRSPG
ncbi:MAG: 5-formyltetrahydrofolate cyclo-ligase [Gammaproteobacteria bacterium]|nr:5-formyltetrahydrofolate cyclo-ligase [Gammaproteobacteria bacterium]